MWFALQAARTLLRAATIWDPGPRRARARNAERHGHVAGSPFGEADAGNFQILVGIFERVFVFEFKAEEQFAVGVERPGVGFLHVLVLGDAPDLGGGGVAVDAAASFCQTVISDACADGRESEPLRRRRARAGVVGMGEQDAVDAGGEHLVEHPGVGVDGRFIDAVDGNVDDDRRRAMTALVGRR